MILSRTLTPPWSRPGSAARRSVRRSDFSRGFPLL